jgi:hypothetical protein
MKWSEIDSHDTVAYTSVHDIVSTDCRQARLLRLCFSLGSVMTCSLPLYHRPPITQLWLPFSHPVIRKICVFSTFQCQNRIRYLCLLFARKLSDSRCGVKIISCIWIGSQVVDLGDQMRSPSYKKPTLQVHARAYALAPRLILGLYPLIALCDMVDS